MFKNKKAVLFEAPAAKSTSKSSKGNTSAFVQGAMAKSAETRSGNGALKYSIE